MELKNSLPSSLPFWTSRSPFSVRFADVALNTIRNPWASPPGPCQSSAPHSISCTRGLGCESLCASTVVYQMYKKRKLCEGKYCPWSQVQIQVCVSPEARWTVMTGFVDLLRIPLARGIPWAVPHQQGRLLSCPTYAKMQRESGHTSLCVAPLVSLPVLPPGRSWSDF